MKHSAYVLSLSEETRTEFLIRDLRIHVEAKVILGVKGDSFAYSNYGNEAKISQLLSNRILTRNEIACVDGHRRMINQAVKDDVDIAYFLEDDAAIPSNFCDLIEEASLFNQEPSLCLISYEREKVLCRKIRHGKLRNFYKCYALPTCAQFYMLNKAALILLDKGWQTREYAEVADFPTWYWDKVNFLLAPSNRAAPVIRQDSTIGFARFDNHTSDFLKRVGKYSCVFWVCNLREFMSLRAYTAMVHARLIRILLNTLRR